MTVKRHDLTYTLDLFILRRQDQVQEELWRKHQHRHDVSENPENRLVHERVGIIPIDNKKNVFNKQIQQVQAEPQCVVDDELLGF